MFRKVVRRFTLGALLVVSVAALAAATGGSAGLPPVPTTSTPSHDGATPSNACPGAGINERHYCLVVTTYNGLDQNGGVEVDLTLQNYDQSSLTNPTASLSWNNGSVTDGANLSFVSSNPSICTGPTSGGPVNCSFPNLPGLGSAADSSHQAPCGPSGPICSTVKLYFTAASTVSSVDFSANADVKESNQQNGANLDEQIVDRAPMTFDANSTDAFDATVALPNKSPLLKGSFGGHKASVTFPAGSSPFLAQFQEDQASACFPGISCTLLQVTTDLSAAPSGTFSANNPILWTADVTANNTNVLATHTYDSVRITPSPPKTLTTAGTRFANCDGVVFDSLGVAPNTQPNLTLGQIYFVRNATTALGNTSFQVSATAKGSIIAVTDTSAISGSCIRIIGDQKAERVTGCTLAPPPPPSTPAVPGICGAKIDNSTVRVYLWDDSNGHVGY